MDSKSTSVTNVYMSRTPNMGLSLFVSMLMIYSSWVANSNNEVIKTTKEMFNNKFDMKDLGVVDVILGIKISKTLDGLILSQSHYIEKILKKFKQDDSSPMITPVDVNLHLSKNNGRSLSQQEYAQAIGRQPDVCHELYPSRHSLRYQQIE